MKNETEVEANSDEMQKVEKQSTATITSKPTK